MKIFSRVVQMVYFAVIRVHKIITKSVAVFFNYESRVGKSVG